MKSFSEKQASFLLGSYIISYGVYNSCFTAAKQSEFNPEDSQHLDDLDETLHDNQNTSLEAEGANNGQSLSDSVKSDQDSIAIKNLFDESNAPICTDSSELAGTHLFFLITNFI